MGCTTRTARRGRSTPSWPTPPATPAWAAAADGTASTSPAAPDVELTTHGVPDAGPAATREQTPAAASVCCDTGTAQSCCDASAKSSCCEDTTANWRGCDDAVSGDWHADPHAGSFAIVSAGGRASIAGPSPVGLVRCGASLTESQPEPSAGDRSPALRRRLHPWTGRHRQRHAGLQQPRTLAHATIDKHPDE